MSMSRRFWLGLLRKAIAKLLGLDWEMVQVSVKALMESGLSGEEKRRLALAQLRMVGVETATWLLSAAIEVAYGEIKSKVESDD